MSFTQEKRTNVGVCNGCEKRCVFGVHQEILPCPQGQMPVIRWWPTIGNQVIESFIDHNGLTCTTVLTYDPKEDADPEKMASAWCSLIQSTQLGKAYKIAKLCDHYKTR